MIAGTILFILHFHVVIASECGFRVQLEVHPNLASQER
jgi:hypothetical protein